MLKTKKIFVEIDKDTIAINKLKVGSNKLLLSKNVSINFTVQNHSSTFNFDSTPYKFKEVSKFITNEGMTIKYCCELATIEDQEIMNAYDFIIKTFGHNLRSILCQSDNEIVDTAKNIEDYVYEYKGYTCPVCGNYTAIKRKCVVFSEYEDDYMITCKHCDSLFQDNMFEYQKIDSIQNIDSIIKINNKQ